MRLGVLGGTYDPPHVGHLLAASDAFEALSLDRLLFVPAAVPPYKSRSVKGSPEQRLRMLELTIGSDARFEASHLELDRDGLSFTVDTLAALSAETPGVSLFMLIGEDLATQIAAWRDAARIAELATIVVLERMSSTKASALESSLPMTRLATRRIELSSTEIRDRIQAGRSIHGFVTDAVAAFIDAAGLYR
ncbi:MAG: nicotinate (nicotinamide) nucleotide adenylyltransferase [Gemmatimonadaceae bacterium]|nr:nicotinate (nicotinamide) nucleotide adenylyltransferase [Gemmatimonadaceae bacterium]